LEGDTLSYRRINPSLKKLHTTSHDKEKQKRGKNVERKNTHLKTEEVFKKQIS
jgi:hypothetical protein